MTMTPIQNSKPQSKSPSSSRPPSLYQPPRTWQQHLKNQLQTLYTHVINVIGNLLGNDWFSSQLRTGLLRQLGNQIGRNTRINGGSYFFGGRLKTGHHCHINRDCYFDFTGPITLGDHVVIGHGVTFITAHHSLGPAHRRAGPVIGKAIVIGSGTWIGANVTLLPGITIGPGAIIGANAVVTRSIPANVLAAGIPAKKIRTLEAPAANGKDLSSFNPEPLVKRNRDES